VVEEILRRRPHPEQGFRSSLGLMRLARTGKSKVLLNVFREPSKKNRPPSGLPEEVVDDQ